MKWAAAVLAALATGVAGPSQGAQALATSLLVGTWKLNLDRSSYEGTPAPLSLTVSVEDRGDGLIVTRSEAVLPDGTLSTMASAFKCDGKDYPLVIRQGQSIPLAVSCVSAATRTFVIELKQEAGESVQKTVRTVAEDGRTMTDTLAVILPDGQPVRVVAVLERLD